MLQSRKGIDVESGLGVGVHSFQAIVETLYHVIMN